MLRYFLFFLGMLFSIKMMAQTGIGTTTPNASAKLDVYSENKGFLPPRVSLTSAFDRNTISSPATGLLVYCKGDAGLASGYYYWNGTIWVQIAGGLVIDNKTAGFTLSASDNNKLFLINSSTAVTINVPSLPIGFSCQLIQTGSGAITLAVSGTTLYSANGLTSRATNSVIGLVMNSATTGYVFGDTIY